MNVQYTPAEQVIADVLRAARLPGAPDQILISPMTAERLSNRIFDRLHKGGFLVADAGQRPDAVETIRSVMLRSYDRNLPIEGTQKSEAALVGQIFSALDSCGYLLQAE